MNAVSPRERSADEAPVARGGGPLPDGPAGAGSAGAGPGSADPAASGPPSSTAAAPPAKSPRAVFVSDFVHVPRPYGELAGTLMDPAAAWLARVGDDIPSRYLVSTGQPRELNQMVTVPIDWTPASLDRLLPTLEADLQLSHLDGQFSRLGISGRYRPPLATLGLTIDRLALHRVAESSLRRFLLGVEHALTADLEP